MVNQPQSDEDDVCIGWYFVTKNILKLPGSKNKTFAEISRYIYILFVCKIDHFFQYLYTILSSYPHLSKRLQHEGINKCRALASIKRKGGLQGMGVLLNYFFRDLNFFSVIITLKILTKALNKYIMHVYVYNILWEYIVDYFRQGKRHKTCHYFGRTHSTIFKITGQQYF